MARIFITGSSDGLGRMAAQLLVEQGHAVVLHARNEQRGREAMAAVPGAEAVVTGQYFYHKQLRKPSGATQAPERQDRLLAECKRLSGVDLPSG